MTGVLQRYRRRCRAGEDLGCTHLVQYSTDRVYVCSDPRRDAEGGHWSFDVWWIQHPSEGAHEHVQIIYYLKGIPKCIYLFIMEQNVIIHGMLLSE